MAEEKAILKVIQDLKTAVSAILQGYGDGQGPVTDASAELHRLCGCLELLLQFDQREQRSFLGARKDYWDFLCTALRRQCGDTEQVRFICSQDKLKTPLGKGRAFIRLCLVQGQLAESLQLCLLSPKLTRDWYGLRSPLLCPELREDILDSLYCLNGVTFDLDLQRPDLDGAWPMFSESQCSDSNKIQGRRPRKTKGPRKEVSPALKHHGGEQRQGSHTCGVSCLHHEPEEKRLLNLPSSPQGRHLPIFLEKKKESPRSLSCSQSMWEPKGEEFLLDQEQGVPKMGRHLGSSTAHTQQQRELIKKAQEEVTGMEVNDKVSLSGTDAQRKAEGAHEREANWGCSQQPPASRLQGKVVSAAAAAAAESGTGLQQTSVVGQFWVPEGLATKESSTTEKPQESTRVTSMTRPEDQAESPLQEVVKGLRHGLQQAKERAQHQEQLLRAQEGELQALQEQLSRCQGERARLQAELEQKQQEAERREAMYEEELAGQRDLIQAMKKRVLELIHEKDRQWQRFQQLSAVSPGQCVGCSKVFWRLSRRYPCRLCGGLVCHACSADYKKRERCCPTCAQGEGQSM